MRNFIVTGRILFTTFILLLGVNHQSFASLSGTYSVNPSGSASSTVYKDLGSVISDMTSGTRSDGGTANGSGVSGAVTIQLEDGTYTGPFTIGSITGASATNTITLASKNRDSSKVILTNPSSANAANDFTLYMNGADFMIFKQITIIRTGVQAYSTVIYMAGGSHNNQFLNCVLYGKNQPSTATIGFQVGGNSVIWSAGSDSNNLYYNNHIVNGYNGFFTTAGAGSNRFINNTFDSAGSSAIYCLSQQRFVMEGNLVRLHPFTTAPYVSYGIRIETSPSFRISKNRFYAEANATVSRTIVLFNCNSSVDNPAIISNNFLLVTGGTTSSTGIAIGGNTNLDIVYNNVLVTASVSGSAAFFVYAPPQASGSSNKLLNNNFINKGYGYALAAPGNGSNIGGIDTSDYNNLYSNGTYIAQEGVTNYTTNATWTAGVLLDSHSIKVDPGFYSMRDFHATAKAIDGAGRWYGFIKDDIDNQARSSTPDIGADEFTPAALDGGIISVDSPAFYCAGTQRVAVKFSNYGTNTISTCSLGWSINGAVQTPIYWTGTVNAGTNSGSVFLGTFAPTTNTKYDIKVWSYAPNSGTDGLNINDTIMISKYSAMSGTYTIGASSSDFKNFNDAVIALTNRGLCGPTIINVANGTYYEQFSIPQFVGTSTTNTVTWQSASKDSSKVIISHATTTANGVNNCTVQINGGDNNIFKQVTFIKTGTLTYGNVLEIKSGAMNNTFDRNLFIGTKIGSTVAANNQIVISAGDQDFNTVFRQNRFKYGNSGIDLTGNGTDYETGTIIENNIFDSIMQRPIILTENLRPRITGNTITNTGYSTGAGTGVYLSACDSGFIVTNNKMYFPFGGLSSVYSIYSYGDASNRALIANNFITMAYNTSSTQTRAIEIDDADYTDIDHNSVLITNRVTASSNPASAFYSLNGAGNIRVRNNILSNMGGGPTIDLDNNGIVSECDYNVLFSTSTTDFAMYGGSGYGSLTAWRTASGLDSHSINAGPQYVSSTDLHLTASNTSIFKKGKAVPRVTTDIDGHPRNPATPDPGADETVNGDDVGVASLDSIKSLICLGSQRVILNVSNFGSNTVTTSEIGAKIYNSAGTLLTTYTQTYKTTINPTSTNKGVYMGTYNFSTAGVYRIKAWASNPNGLTDESLANDTSFTILTVVSPPKPSITGNSSGCANSFQKYSATSTGTGTYAWTLTGGTHVGAKTGDTTSIRLGTGSTASLKVVQDNGSCKDSATSVITINAIPSAKITGTDTLCSGTTTTYQSVGTGGVTYSWTVVGAKINTSGQSVNVTWGTTATGSIKLKATSSAGCIDSSNMAVKINTRPKASILTDSFACENQAETIKTSVTSGYKYSWKSTGTPAISNTDTLVSVFSNLTGQSVGLTVTDNNGCKDSIQTQIAIRRKPKGSFVYTIIGTTGMNVDFKATDTTLSKYAWDFGDVNNGVGYKTNHNYSTNGAYKVQLTFTDQYGCFGIDNQIVQRTTIEYKNQSLTLKMYPNPTTDKVNVEFSEPVSGINIQMIDAQGRKVMENNNISGYKMQMDIESLPQGLYYMNIMSKSGEVMKVMGIQKW